MSVFKYLCLACMLCFVLADPVQSPSEITAAEMQKKVEALMIEMENSMKTHLAPIFGQLDAVDQDYLEKTILEVISEFLNYVEIQINQKQDELNEFSTKCSEVDIV